MQKHRKLRCRPCPSRAWPSQLDSVLWQLRLTRTVAMCFEQLSLRLEHDACRACWAEAGCGAEVWTGAGFSFKA